jgi:hypothetical protein
MVLSFRAGGSWGDALASFNFTTAEAIDRTSGDGISGLDKVLTIVTKSRLSR